jgi:REP element-mobilizing transposase RayT/DNA-directed RNA polymerase subunit F
MWSVWKHTGNQGDLWKIIMESEDENYARQVFRFTVETTKKGMTELRNGDKVEERLVNEAIENLQPQPTVASKRIFETNDHRKTQEEQLEEIAKTHPKLKAIHTKYKQGNIRPIDFLAAFVLQIHDLFSTKPDLALVTGLHGELTALRKENQALRHQAQQSSELIATLNDSHYAFLLNAAASGLPETVHMLEESSFACQYLIVLIPRRKKVITDSIGIRIQEVIRHSAAELGGEATNLYVLADHVHFIVHCTPQTEIYNFILQLKRLTSHALREEFPSFRPKPGYLIWSKNYYVATIGNRATPTELQRFVDSQNG